MFVSFMKISACWLLHRLIKFNKICWEKRPAKPRPNLRTSFCRRDLKNTQPHLKVGLVIFDFCTHSRRLISKDSIFSPNFSCGCSYAEHALWCQDSKCRALGNYFPVRIYYEFLISKCRGDWDLDLCTFGVFAFINPLSDGKIRFFLRAKRVFFLGVIRFVKTLSKRRMFVSFMKISACWLLLWHRLSNSTKFVEKRDLPSHGQTCGHRFADVIWRIPNPTLTPMGQLHQSPPSSVPGDRARGKQRGFSPGAAGLPLAGSYRSRTLFIYFLCSFSAFFWFHFFRIFSWGHSTLSPIFLKSFSTPDFVFSQISPYWPVPTARLLAVLTDQSWWREIWEKKKSGVVRISGKFEDKVERLNFFFLTFLINNPYELWRAASGARRLRGWSPSACRAPGRCPSHQSHATRT